MRLHLVLKRWKNWMSKCIFLNSPVGILYLCESEGKIVGITKHPQPVTQTCDVLEMCKKQLLEYFNHQRVEFDLPLSYQGTAFQCAVWKAMKQIKYGECVSYQQLAKLAQVPDAVRAVGTACGKNPIAIVIPCHRVIKSDGKIGNYAWGSEMKQFLIDLEEGE